MTSRGGQSTFGGVNAQAWAAMSLLLQYVDKPDFRYIGFEGKNLEDFYLVFADGKKIICESKASKIGLSEIKGILEKVANHGQVTGNDEVLIICESVETHAKNTIENYEYYSEGVKRVLMNRRHGYKEEHIKLLPKLRFWEIPQDISRQTVDLLVARLLKIWVPKHRLSEVVSELVEREVYQGSQKGATLSKEEFLEKLENKKHLIFEDARYEKDKVKKEHELAKLIQESKDPSSSWWTNNSLSILSSNFDEHYWLLTLLEKENKLNLRSWNPLWQMSVQGTFVMEVFKIFKKNIVSTENQDYFMERAANFVDCGVNFYRDDFIKTDIVDICKLILSNTRKHDETVFELIKKLLEPSIGKYFYTKYQRDDQYERGEISKLLLDLYKRTTNLQLKENIVGYIFSEFNLVEDDGQFWYYTPDAIFEIIRSHFKDNPKNGILTLTPQFSEQFDTFYKQFGKKFKFKGWEHMGSGISQSGSVFSLPDRHFVTQILRPLVDEIRKEERWEFLISNNCITTDADKISAARPDFLNRASLEVIFDEYKGGKHHKEAFVILSDFIKMRKGIPWKADLIFQKLKNGDYSEQQKWDLVEVSLKAYKDLPVNVFVEQIVYDLVSSGHLQAGETISRWAENKDYEIRRMTGSYGEFSNNVSKLLESDKDAVFKRGTSIFRNYLKNLCFVQKDNDWDTWDAASILAKIITTKPERGIPLLIEVGGTPTLSQNQQTLITSAINDLDKVDKELLKQVYIDFLKPFLGSCGNDISKIEKRVSSPGAREQIVQFAEKMAKAGLLDEAMAVVRIFINDSNPSKSGSNEKDDPNGTFNYHQRMLAGEDQFTINTVRGWCCWVLQKFATLQGRDYLPETVTLVKQLTTDPNCYVRLQACTPLIDLMRNRHTVLPSDQTQRFMPYELACQIEEIIFEMLRDKENQKIPSLMRHIGSVFSFARSLDQKQAMEVLTTYWDVAKSVPYDRNKEQTVLNKKVLHPSNIIDEMSSLYIYYAEFRKNAFKSPNFIVPFGQKKWEDLNKFDDDPFKLLLKDMLQNSSDDIRAKFAWHFWTMPKETNGNFDELFNISYEYLLVLTDRYDHALFEKIYYFISGYIDKKFEDCFALWKQCIETESKFFEKNYSKDNLQEMYWWPSFYNGKILLKIAKFKGNQEFLKWFEKLVAYPVDLLIAHDLDEAVEYLVTIKTSKKRIAQLFKSLIERNSKYFEYKQRWNEKVN